MALDTCGTQRFRRRLRIGPVDAPRDGDCKIAVSICGVQDSLDLPQAACLEDGPDLGDAEGAVENLHLVYEAVE